MDNISREGQIPDTHLCAAARNGGALEKETKSFKHNVKNKP